MSYKVKIEQAMAKVVIADLKADLANGGDGYRAAYDKSDDRAFS